jgi:hypothetical protein
MAGPGPAIQLVIGTNSVRPKMDGRIKPAHGEFDFPDSGPTWMGES